MHSAAECRKRAAQKRTQAESDPRHKRKLIAAAQAWLLLAGNIMQIEKLIRHRRATVR